MNDKPVMLITSIGKRVQLIEHLKKNFFIIGADAGELNPGRYFVDKFYKIPRADEEEYIKSLIEICKNEDVKIIIPLYEGEFEKLDKARYKFEEIGTILMLSGEKVLDICKDKRKMYDYFCKSNIKVSKLYFECEIDNIILKNDENKFPLFIKPADGMGSYNTFKINNTKELEFFKDYVENGIVQDFIDGEEYTVDCMVDLDGSPIHIIPRKRIEVRAGEVVKSCTVYDEELIKKTTEVISWLNKAKDKKGMGTVGPLTIQFFRSVSNDLILLEINPRFGGGVPLSFEAGADYGKIMYKMVKKEKIERLKSFKEKTMLRYEQAVFIN